MLSKICTEGSNNDDNTKVRTSNSVVATEKDDSDLTSSGRIVQHLPTSAQHRALRNEVFVRLFHSETIGTFRIGYSADFLVALVGLLAIGFVVAGSVLPSISYEGSGLIAEIIVAGDLSKVVYRQHYSVISLAQRLIADAQLLGDRQYIFGLWLFAAFIVLTILVTPVMCVCGLMAQWFCPLRTQTRNRVASLTDRFRAWQYTETFFLSAVTVSSTFQLSDISHYLVGPYCESLGGVIMVGVDLGLVSGPTLNCYVLNSSVEIGLIFLLLGVFCVALLYIFITSASEQIRLAKESSITSASYSKSIRQASSSNDNVTTCALIQRIAWVPAVFSERFLWCVYPSDETIITGSTQQDMLGSHSPALTSLQQQTDLRRGAEWSKERIYL